MQVWAHQSESVFVPEPQKPSPTQISSFTPIIPFAFVFIPKVKPQPSLCGLKILHVIFAVTWHFTREGQSTLNDHGHFCALSLWSPCLCACTSVCVVCESVNLSAVCFIVPCGKGSGCSGRQAAVTPFPPDSFPVPSTAAVVQPVSDLCCAHTDTDTHRISTQISHMRLHISHMDRGNTHIFYKRHTEIEISLRFKLTYEKNKKQS